MLLEEYEAGHKFARGKFVRYANTIPGNAFRRFGASEAGPVGEAQKQ